MAPEERISIAAFCKINPIEPKRFKYHSSESVKQAVANHVFPLPDVLPKKEKPVVPITDNDSVQQKITPWELMMQTDICLQGQHVVAKPRFPIIVMASFVSKSPNLGGLCRTCEIFNAELLVVHSLAATKESGFVSTSVSADRWMPLKQVPQDDVNEYLLAMKRQGYEIIGLEQANTSVSLESFKFPRKCILVLGREKEGMPVEVMPLLDHIVEIPQFGKRF